MAIISVTIQHSKYDHFRFFVKVEEYSVLVQFSSTASTTTIKPAQKHYPDFDKIAQSFIIGTRVCIAA